MGRGGSLGQAPLAAPPYDALTIAPLTRAPLAPHGGAGRSVASVGGIAALGACGEIAAGVNPTTELRDNQLGRLWHPCDAVVDAFPTTCF